MVYRGITYISLILHPGDFKRYSRGIPIFLDLNGVSRNYLYRADITSWRILRGIAEESQYFWTRMVYRGIAYSLLILRPGGF
jgi:hypothetical protein